MKYESIKPKSALKRGVKVGLKQIFIERLDRMVVMVSDVALRKDMSLLLQIFHLRKIFRIIVFQFCCAELRIDMER